jgi:N-acetylglucosamine-6-phosphate deacetylase
LRLGVRHALAGGEIVSGDVDIADGLIAEVGVFPPGHSGLAVPGFVDLQVNGFAGVDFLAADRKGYAIAGDALAATGVTAYQPTFISSPLQVYRTALETASEPSNVAGPRMMGVHLEGPFLSRRWPGAHIPDNILDVDLDVAKQLCEWGPVTCMTIAPEVPGGIELIRFLRNRDIVVSCGHSDSDAPTAHAAFDAGARAITHIYNAHRRFDHRDPGIAGAALVRPDVTVQAIVDNVHLAPETAYAAFLATRSRFALVTDAIAATGQGPGTYRLGGRTITVRNNRAELTNGILAGSILTMDQAVRNLVDLGVSLTDAIAAASAVPARLIARGDRGELYPGGPADVVVFDDALQPTRTLVRGVEVFRR